MQMRGLVTLLALLGLAPRARGTGGGEIPVPRPAPSAAKAAPGNLPPEALYNSGEQLAAKGDWKQAEAAYRRAIQARDQFPEAWNGLGHALKKQRKYGEALDAYKQAHAMRPQS